ncbi:MAG: prepilin-type N-terminal cleavage/methylation domain-containing protein [Candidatus Omnitrophica bacterium]|nr:prepilin-type N-terminal cleavage/methylation domain-containing protein [Candidatus Omnitrophota bacterium]
MILPVGRPNQLKSNGFTLIELVLVASIILILVAVTAPQFRGPFQKIQLKNTCQNLVQLMRYAQARAVAERRLCRINFDLEEMSFWLTSADAAEAGKFSNIQGRWGRRFKFAQGVSVQLELEGEANEERFITFYPDGSQEKARVQITDRAGETFTITTQRNVQVIQE